MEYSPLHLLEVVEVKMLVIFSNNFKRRVLPTQYVSYVTLARTKVNKRTATGICVEHFKVNIKKLLTFFSRNMIIYRSLMKS